jgi:hypothetical protein
VSDTVSHDRIGAFSLFRASSRIFFFARKAPGMKTLQRQVAGKTVLEWICYVAAQIKEVNGNWSREGGDLTVTAHSGDVVTLVRAGRRFHGRWESGQEDAS